MAEIRANCKPSLGRRKWYGETGRVDDLLRKYTDQWGLNGANSIGYICGHPMMIENSMGILKRIGFVKKPSRKRFTGFQGRAPSTCREDKTQGDAALLDAGHNAAALQQEDISPFTGEFADSLPPPHFAESAGLV